MIADVVLVTSWVQLAIAIIGLAMAIAVWDSRRMLRDQRKRQELDDDEPDL